MPKREFLLLLWQAARRRGAAVRKRSWLDELREKNDKARQQKKKPAPGGAAEGDTEGMLASCLEPLQWPL